MIRGLIRGLAILLALTGGLAAASCLSVPARAALAQALLRHAWAARPHAPSRPWPWADTEVVGRLLVPAKGIDQILLSPAGGEALAFAPALSHHAGLSVIRAHRDTHFSFLSALAPGMRLQLEEPGKVRDWRVTERLETDRSARLVADPTQPVLALVTCLDGPAGVRRLVVLAVPEGPGAVSPVADSGSPRLR